MAGKSNLPKLLVALLCMGVTLVFTRFDFMRTVELKTLDYRFRLLGPQHTASPDIVIVEIDDNSIKHLEPVFGRWPWPRDAHAMFLRFMQTAGARVVAYDVLFTDQDVQNPEADQEFAEETARSGNVVHAVFLGNQFNQAVSEALDPEVLKQNSLPRHEGFTEFVDLDLPFLPLSRGARNLGHVANVLDADGPFRRYLGFANFQEVTLPSLAVSTVLASEGLSLKDVVIDDKEFRAGSIRYPLGENKRIPIWYNGGPGTYKSFPYGHVIYAQYQIEQGEAPGIDPELFRDKIVLVGVTAAGLYDLFTTPFAGSSQDSATSSSGVRLGKMAGVEVHANVVDNILHGRYLSQLPGSMNVLIGLIMAMTVLWGIFRVRLWSAATLAVTLLVAYLLAAQFSFSHYLQIPVAPILLGWSLTVMLGFGYQYWFEGAEKRKVKAVFSRYVSKDIYKQLLDNPEAATLGGKRTVVTVLFSDLRGFTSMSENRAPEDIVAQLNHYFTAMVELVFKHKGTVDKFVGDMIMALFSAPLEDPDHADHAVQCAIAMQKRLAELNQEWGKEGLPSLACGVGINTGEMIAGNVGAESIFSYTVIGDNVNLGARLESLCKDYKVSIIISEYTHQVLRQKYDLNELGEVTVKGKSRPVRIFEVRGSTP